MASSLIAGSAVSSISVLGGLTGSQAYAVGALAMNSGGFALGVFGYEVEPVEYPSQYKYSAPSN